MGAVTDRRTTAVPSAPAPVSALFRARRAPLGLRGFREIPAPPGRRVYRVFKALKVFPERQELQAPKVCREFKA